ncbi:MAG: hypothetical protein H6737_09030 [Alphaproteobacteria bacterium]|nr:hypothetical protein [Alphaproteobacteria bacterium]
MSGDREKPSTTGGEGQNPSDELTLVQRTEALALDDDSQADTGFDYAKFEESLDDLDAETTDDPATDPGSTIPIVHERFTLDTRRFPKDDATTDIRELGDYTVITIRGRINESFEGQELGRRLRGRVVFDLTEVDRVTSFGVRAWLQMLDVARLKEAVFVRASPAIVNQVTMMRNFCGPATIHSIVAPYACGACGAEFGVPYEAATDRTPMRARNPLKVACPECHASAEMDEDPWVFFALDEVLMETVSPDLARVIQNIGDRPRHAPIEKAIVGDATRVRFNGSVSGDTRFQRAFGGLEGHVTVDLRTANEVDNEGVNGLLDQLTRLPQEVKQVIVEGAPPALLRGLLSASPRKVFVASALVTARATSRPMHREVLVDLKRDRASITAGTFVPDVPWTDPSTVDGLEVLAEAVARLLPPDKQPTPVPAQRVQAAPPAQTPAPAPAPAPAANNNTMMLVGVGVVSLAVVALLLGSVGLGVVFGGDDMAKVTQAPAPIEAPAPVAEVAPGQWSPGGALPPSWSEIGVSKNGDQLLLVGHGAGSSAPDASVAARRAALDRLLLHVSTAVTTPFEDEALPSEGPERERALAAFELATSALNLTRAQESVKIDGDRVELVSQYAVDASAVDAFVAGYTRSSEFRGIVLRESPPWVAPRVRLVERESFIRNVAPGDRLVSVAGRAVDTLAAFDATAAEVFAGLEPGGALSLEFDRDGRPVQTSVYKPNRPNPDRPVAPSQTAPVPRPTLFKKD